MPDEVDWRFPLQLLSGLHYLVLSGRASWDDVRGALRDEDEFLRGWLATERVQTNEVRRCWWLLPCFLEVARRTGCEVFDCVELGCSAGLNLLWDRYGYTYANGSWGGSCTVQLAGVERGRLPAETLALRPVIRSRVGVDAAPPDLRTEDGVRYLKAFVWPDQDERLERLDEAVAVWRKDPPEILTGDLVDELPRLLARKRDDAVLLVWETATFAYLPRERREQATALIDAAPCVFVRTWHPRDGNPRYYGLFVDGDEVGHGEFHGAWLDWRA